MKVKSHSEATPLLLEEKGPGVEEPVRKKTRNNNERTAKIP